MSKDLVPLSTKAVQRSVATRLAVTMFGTAGNADAATNDANPAHMKHPVPSNDVDQQKSKVGRDQIGVQNNITYVNVGSVAGIEALLIALQTEIDNNIHAAETIAKLQRFQRPSPHRGIVGLQAKLVASGRAYEYDEAIEMKELFAKLVEKFSLYASAQEIICLLLARVEYHFRQFIYPQLSELSIVQVNEIVDRQIVAPSVQECSSSVFGIDHSVAMGMIYWLAEQCHIRWHQ